MNGRLIITVTDNGGPNVKVSAETEDLEGGLLVIIGLLEYTKQQIIQQNQWETLLGGDST